MLVCASTFESLNIEVLWIKWLQLINKFHICVKPLKAESLILSVLFEIHFVVSRQNDKTCRCPNQYEHYSSVNVSHQFGLN